VQKNIINMERLSRTTCNIKRSDDALIMKNYFFSSISINKNIYILFTTRTVVIILD